MKRHLTEQEKIFVKHVSDKGLIANIYIYTRNSNNPIVKKSKKQTTTKVNLI